MFTVVACPMVHNVVPRFQSCRPFDSWRQWDIGSWLVIAVAHIENCLVPITMRSIFPGMVRFEAAYSLQISFPSITLRGTMIILLTAGISQHYYGYSAVVANTGWSPIVDVALGSIRIDIWYFMLYLTGTALEVSKHITQCAGAFRTMFCLLVLF